MNKSSASSAGSKPLPPAIRRGVILYLLILITFFTVEWGYAYVQFHILHAQYPRTTPLFNPVSRFSDWTNFLPRVARFGTPNMQTDPSLGPPFPYPLPCVYLYLGFIRLFHDSTRAFYNFSLFTFFAITAAFLVYLCSRAAGPLLQTVVLLTLLLGSPAAFLLDRGNIEVVLWLFVALGLSSFIYGWKYTAAILFAAAACMKIYPALYLLLFVPRRQWKALALGIAASALFTLAAIQGIGPTLPVAIHDMAGSARLLKEAQILPLARESLRWDHSLLAEYKQIVYTIAITKDPAAKFAEMDFSRAAAIYSVVIPLLVFLLYLFRIRTLPLLNQTFCLCILSLLAPYVSYEYTLVSIYLVFGLFLLYCLQDGDSLLARAGGRWIALVFLCFAVIVAPLALLAHENHQGQIKGLAMLVLLAFALRVRMPSRLFHDDAATLTFAGTPAV